MKGDFAHVQYNTKNIQLLRLANLGMVNLHKSTALNMKLVNIEDKQAAKFWSNDHVKYHTKLPIL
jgi:hypothetical protein